MSTPYPPMGEPTLDHEIAQMRQLLLELSEAAQALQLHLRRKDNGGMDKTAPLIRELRGLVRLAIDTKIRFDSYRTQDREGRDAPQLALDTARDQIGRRLDRLRAAEDAGGVS